VVLARDSQTDSNVAIKCLTKSRSSDSSDDSCPLYRQELHYHSVLDNFKSDLVGADHVIHCVDAFETSQNAFLVLEYCDLGDLYENILQGRIPRDTQTVKDMLLQLVDALEFCHAAGVYHRDIKPENILMSVMDDGSGRPILKLGDFGLATHETWTTDVGTGSDRYMAPEQYESIRDGYSPEKADIWAVGCCLLNLVFARNAFKIPSTSDPIFADYVRDPMSICDVFADMSTDTFEVLKYSLAVDPAKRDLQKVRRAIINLENFTDSETADDCEEQVNTDFTCYVDEPITCTVHDRAPLRTPSLAQNQPFFSSVPDAHFSWASAAQKPSNTIHRIEESEDEDAEDSTSDVASVKDTDRNDDGRSSDSGLGTSLGSLSINTPRFPSTRSSKFNIGSKFNSAFLPTPPSNTSRTSTPTTFRPMQSIATRKVTDIPGKNTSSSVPITSSTRGILSKYIQESSDRLKFGKSWSDWVEEEEEDEAEKLSRGDSHGSESSSLGSSFGEEANDDDGGWWEGIHAAHGWED